MATNGKSRETSQREPIRPPHEIGSDIECLAGDIEVIHYLAEAGIFFSYEGSGGQQQHQYLLGVLEGISALTARARDLANAYGPELRGLPVHHNTKCHCAYCCERKRRGKEPWQWTGGEQVPAMPAAPSPAAK